MQMCGVDKKGHGNNDENSHASIAIQQMLEATEQLIARRFRTLRSLVILQDQKILCARSYGRSESNLPGVKQLESTQSAQNHPSQIPNYLAIAPVKSVTKSVIAMLVGIALDQKLMASVKQPLPMLLSSHASCFERHPEAARLTLHHLLSMSTGMTWRDGRAGIEPLLGRMMQQVDWVDFTLSLPIVAADVGRFQYNSAVSHVLSAIIQNVAGMSTAAFACEYLFTPLGITDFAWQCDEKGINVGGWGLSLSALSMAKLGLLCISNGQHQGRQIVSSQWIDKMWSPSVGAKSLHAKSQPADYHAASYGYQWWLRGKAGLALYCAEGAGGQAIFCLPAAGAVIVTSCEYTRRPVSLWPLMEKYWIPVVLQCA